MWRCSSRSLAKSRWKQRQFCSVEWALASESASRSPPATFGREDTEAHSTPGQHVFQVGCCTNEIRIKFSYLQSLVLSQSKLRDKVGCLQNRNGLAAYSGDASVSQPDFQPGRTFKFETCAFSQDASGRGTQESPSTLSSALYSQNGGPLKILTRADLGHLLESHW